MVLWSLLLSIWRSCSIAHAHDGINVVFSPNIVLDTQFGSLWKETKDAVYAWERIWKSWWQPPSTWESWYMVMWLGSNTGLATDVTQPVSALSRSSGRLLHARQDLHLHWCIFAAAVFTLQSAPSCSILVLLGAFSILSLPRMDFSLKFVQKWKCTWIPSV